jgi:uncharacterized cupredoxin-like copper-binding protein
MKRLFLLLCVAGLALGACGGGDGEEAHEEAQEVTITALDELRYEPDTVEVVAGQPVALTLVNEGVLDHDFSIVDVPLDGEVEIHAAEDEHDEEEEHDDEHEMTMDEDELALHVMSMPEGTRMATFTVSEPGSYKFICTVPGHEEAGMVGTLVVAAP